MTEHAENECAATVVAAAAAEYKANQESGTKLTTTTMTTTTATMSHHHPSPTNKHNVPEEPPCSAAAADQRGGEERSEKVPPVATAEVAAAAADTIATTTTTPKATIPPPPLLLTSAASADAKEQEDTERDPPDQEVSSLTALSLSSSSFVPQIAKDRLSKWATRLFDPNRPKGVIPPPQTIPLNDEFLQAFGKREQAMDAMTGSMLTIDRTIPDDNDDDDDDDNHVGVIKEPTSEVTTASSNTIEPLLAVDAHLPTTNNNSNDKSASTTAITTTSGKSSRNVKISNLRYTTTQSELESLCKRFGDIEKLTLIKNPSDETKHLGVAYVLFVTLDAAARCLVELKIVQDRPVTVTEAKQAGDNPSRKRKVSRYWETESLDLSLKCYHCGLYGHLASACQNAKLLKPCTLCGVTSHDARNCDKKVFCFTCGLPGHPSRDCPDRNQPVRRLLCTICYGVDHHKSQCRGLQYRDNNGDQQQQPYGLANAVCMVCGKLGHFSCQRVSVFYGLRGVCCCNCGALGHTIQNCCAPNLAMCDRNQGMMHDAGWTADQVQVAIVQLNQGQVVRPVTQDSTTAAAAGRGDRHHRPSDRRYNHHGEANKQSRNR